MVRRAHPLIVGLFWLAGCKVDQPMPMALQDTWTDAERQHILVDMQRWEQATNHLVRFVPSPTPFHDPDGFHRADLDDPANVLYKLERSSPDTDELQQLVGTDLLGYNFATDILIFFYKLAISSGPDESLVWLDPVVLHELGHHIGLSHLEVHRALMNQAVGTSCITQWDLAAFCEIYDCKLRDMHPECIVDR